MPFIKYKVKFEEKAESLNELKCPSPLKPEPEIKTCSKEINSKNQIAGGNPTLKDVVFVTLCAPDVISIKA